MLAAMATKQRTAPPAAALAIPAEENPHRITLTEAGDVRIMRPPPPAKRISARKALRFAALLGRIAGAALGGRKGQRIAAVAAELEHIPDEADEDQEEAPRRRNR